MASRNTPRNWSSRFPIQTSDFTHLHCLEPTELPVYEAIPLVTGVVTWLPRHHVDTRHPFQLEPPFTKFTYHTVDPLFLSQLNILELCAGATQFQPLRNTYSPIAIAMINPVMAAATCLDVWNVVRRVSRRFCRAYEKNILATRSLNWLFKGKEVNVLSRQDEITVSYWYHNRCFRGGAIRVARPKQETRHILYMVWLVFLMWSWRKNMALSLQTSRDEWNLVSNGSKETSQNHPDELGRFGFPPLNGTPSIELPQEVDGLPKRLMVWHK